MRKILLIGVLPDPINGLSMANKTILSGIKQYYKKYQINFINTSINSLIYTPINNSKTIGKLSITKILLYFLQYIQIYKIFFHNIVYITIGQTFFGIILYSPYILVSKLFGKEVIIHIHGDHLHKEYRNCNKIKQKIIHSILSKCNKGIVLSPLLKRNLLPFLPENKVYILFNFMNDELIINSSNYTFYTEKVRLLYLSNLIPTKGIFDLLEATLILQTKNIDFSIDIVGKSNKSYKNELDCYLQKLGKQAVFHDIVKGKEKKELLLKSNIFIFPTFYPMEGQPISIIEAMATGNIILTTNHAGIPDIFEDGKNGLYIEKNDPQSIARQIIKISNDLPSFEKIAKYNIDYANQNYTEKKFIDNFIEIIES